MFVVEVTRKGIIRKTPFTNRMHAQRFADNIRAMPRNRRPERVELRKVAEEEFTVAEAEARRR